MNENRNVQSLLLGDTLIRMTKSNANLYDYTVSAEDVAKDTRVDVTYPHYIDATEAFRAATSRATGEDDDLKVLMNVK